MGTSVEANRQRHAHLSLVLLSSVDNRPGYEVSWVCLRLS